MYFYVLCFQGNLVRELKSKHEKSIWQHQVEILLDLKKKLAALKGTASAAEKNAKNKKTPVLQQNGWVSQQG